MAIRYKRTTSLTPDRLILWEFYPGHQYTIHELATRAGLPLAAATKGLHELETQQTARRTIPRHSGEPDKWELTAAGRVARLTLQTTLRRGGWHNAADLQE